MFYRRQGCLPWSKEGVKDLPCGFEIIMSVCIHFRINVQISPLIKDTSENFFIKNNEYKILVKLLKKNKKKWLNFS